MVALYARVVFPLSLLLTTVAALLPWTSVHGAASIREGLSNSSRSVRQSYQFFLWETLDHGPCGTMIHAGTEPQLRQRFNLFQEVGRATVAVQALLWCFFWQSFREQQAYFTNVLIGYVFLAGVGLLLLFILLSGGLPNCIFYAGYDAEDVRLLVLTPALSLVSATLIVGGLGLRHLAPAPGAVPEFTDDRAR
jgi:hypothetical protein